MARPTRASIRSRTRAGNNHARPPSPSGSPSQSSIPAVALFARRPFPDQAKTRLISLLGPAGAARFQEALIADSLAKLGRLRKVAKTYLFLGGGSPRSFVRWSWTPPVKVTVVEQRGESFGARLCCALQHLLCRHPAAVVIGADSPELTARVIRLALLELKFCDAVLGPCPDGGCYLIGLRRSLAPRHSPRVPFRDVRWGTRYAFRDTLRNLLARSSVVSILDPCRDVDRPGDLKLLARRFRRRQDLRRLSPAVWRFLRAQSRARTGTR